MGIFDIFTGASQKKAAGEQRDYYDALGKKAEQTITTGQNQSLGNIGTGYGNARTSLAGGYSTATGAVNTGTDQGLEFLRTGYDAARGDLNNAEAAYDPLLALSEKYGGATSLALDALGVNGQGGTDAARSAFTAGPAYDFNMEQGLDAINRRRAAGGMLASGNADRDAQTYGAGLASNEYDKWMANLLGFTNPELSATSGAATGVAGVNTARAGLNTAEGAANANLSTSRGAMLADLASRYGTAGAGLDVGEGTSLAAINTNAANSRVNAAQANAPAYANTYKQAADAATAGSSNLWNMGMKVAKMATGMPF